MTVYEEGLKAHYEKEAKALFGSMGAAWPDFGGVFRVGLLIPQLPEGSAGNYHAYGSGPTFADALEKAKVALASRLGMTHDEARAKAKALLGPEADVSYLATHADRGHCIVYERVGPGQVATATVAAEGPTWAAALATAEQGMRERANAAMAAPSSAALKALLAYAAAHARLAAHEADRPSWPRTGGGEVEGRYYARLAELNDALISAGRELLAVTEPPAPHPPIRPSQGPPAPAPGWPPPNEGEFAPFPGLDADRLDSLIGIVRRGNEDARGAKRREPLLFTVPWWDGKAPTRFDMWALEGILRELRSARAVVEAARELWDVGRAGIEIGSALANYDMVRTDRVRK